MKSRYFFVSLLFSIISFGQVPIKIIGDWQSAKNILHISKNASAYRIGFLNQNYSVTAYPLCDIIYYTEQDERVYVTYYAGGDMVILGTENYYRKKNEVKSYTDNWTGNWKNNSKGYLRVKKITNGHYLIISNCGEDYEFNEELELINGSLYSIIDGKTVKSKPAYEYKKGKIFSTNCQSEFNK